MTLRCPVHMHFRLPSAQSCFQGAAPAVSADRQSNDSVASAGKTFGKGNHAQQSWHADTASS